MADTSKIEWTDATWNPGTGCTKVSPGCDNCYAETFAERWRGVPGHHFETGFDVTLRPARLLQPMSWRKPRRIFVNSMSDLFHEKIPDSFIAEVFATMARTPQHTYQCLTKRHGRMRSLLSSQAFRHQVARAIDGQEVDQEHRSQIEESWAPIPAFDGYEASTHGRVRSAQRVLETSLNPQTGRETVTLWNHGAPRTMGVHRLVLVAHTQAEDSTLEVCHRNGNKQDNRLANLRWGTRSENQREKVRHGSRGGPQKLTATEVQEIREARKGGATQQAVADRYDISRSLVSMIENGRVWAEPDLPWPLPNVWLGVSVEDQKWADIRVPALLDTPAAVRFLSCEPLLGPVDLWGPVRKPYGDRPKLTYWLDGRPHWGPEQTDDRGRTFQETAVGPRIDWVIVGGESGPGARPMHPQWARTIRDQCVQSGVPFLFKQHGAYAPETDGHTSGGINLIDLTGQSWNRMEALAPEGSVRMRRVGKKRAGRELDGRTWDEFPEVS